MRARGSAVLVLSLVTLAGSAGATAPRSNRRFVADALTAMPAAKLVKPLRAQREVKWSSPSGSAWQALATTGPWQAAWDRATGVPTRIWGAGVPAPGAIASADVAASFARAWLADHLALLAPGAAPGDFELVSNILDGDLRAVGFVQRHHGRIVVGGQVSFRFKRDRLFVIGSEALPNVALPPAPQVLLARAELHDRATQGLRQELALSDAPVTPPGDEVVLPLIGDDAVLGYRLAVPVTIDGGADGRYLGYADPATGEILAVRQLNLFASGTVLYHAVDRYPAATRPRHDLPAPGAHVMLNGAPQTTSTSGQVSWADGSPQTLSTSVIGDLVVLVNKANGGLATTQIPLVSEGSAVWDASASPEADAQVQTYLSVNIAKGFARKLDPLMAGLDDQITANVNIAQNCNAFFDGKAVNFFRASTDCQNTGLIQDVVFHEYGHAVHVAEIIDGVGAFDGAMSEGAADFFAAQITGDPKMGRGFFYTDEPLRDLDREVGENRWPNDVGEIHKTGIIFGGAFWDLRKQLIIDLHDEQAGAALTQQLFIKTLRTATSIQTSLVDVLEADDDDGNLSTPSPHECTIRNAWGRHGLRTASGVVAAPAALEQPTRSATVRLDLTGLAVTCAGDEIDHAELDWKPIDNGTPVAGSVTAIRTGTAAFYAQLPLATDNKVLYQVQVVFKDGSVMTLPDNLADPYYQLYEGRTVPLYCVDFDAGDPMHAGWSTHTSDGSPSPWVWGAPASGPTDPHAAFSGTHILNQVLNGDYAAGTSSFVAMPTIDVGQWTDVHLQYRRWLAVEDSHFDQARITVGGVPAWINFTENRGDSSAAQHIDREWRFHDVVVSGLQAGRLLDIAWDLTSDQGLQFGGWAIDDVCVVANVNGVCGDGVVTAHESCDDGEANADRPNACRTWCQQPACGDFIVDNGEDCDGGPTGSTTCTDHCETIESPSLGGCCSADRSAGGSCVLGGLVLGLVLRRRQRPRP